MGYWWLRLSVAHTASWWQRFTVNRIVGLLVVIGCGVRVGNRSSGISRNPFWPSVVAAFFMPKERHTMSEDENLIEFKPWPKTPRLNRSILITEKIDGTNAAVIITPNGTVAAQSRNRLIAPGKLTDNYGFARWVEENAEELRLILGVGHHYGEWYGSGIGRGYGLTGGDKRFALFNVNRYEKNPYIHDLDGLELVPVLGRVDGLDTDSIRASLDRLATVGSTAVPGFMRPEGVIVFFSSSNQVYKVLIENDHIPKGLSEATI